MGKDLHQHNNQQKTFFNTLKKTQETRHQKPSHPTDKWGADLNREFSTEESQMAQRHLRNCSASLVIRKMKIKMTLRYRLTPVRMAKNKNTGVGENVE